MADIYPALEDSMLLASVVSRQARGKVLEIGCGSGIQAQTALSNKATRSFLGVDINPAAVIQSRANVNDKRARFLLGDLFSKVPKTKYDTILFNPPYLPDDRMGGSKLDKAATIGGKHGWETIARFLKTAPDYLADKGAILLLFTSLTGKGKVHDLIQDAMLDWSLEATDHIGFETYYVYALRKTQARITAEKKGIQGIKFLAKGKRGLCYAGKLRGKDVVMKVENPASKAIGKLSDEARNLSIVNRIGIGPKLRFASKELIIMDFVKGERIRDWLENAEKRSALKVFNEVLRQCERMDGLHLQKEEMHNPYKHIIVPKKGKPVLIDFERARKMKKPHNVTQFCQYVARSGFVDRETAMAAAKNYAMKGKLVLF